MILRFIRTCGTKNEKKTIFWNFAKNFGFACNLTATVRLLNKFSEQLSLKNKTTEDPEVYLQQRKHLLHMEFVLSGAK